MDENDDGPAATPGVPDVGGDDQAGDPADSPAATDAVPEGDPATTPTAGTESGSTVGGDVRRYRVLSLDESAEAFVFVDLDAASDGATEAYEPIRVAATGYEESLAGTVAALEPGYVVRARLAWPGDGDAERPLARVDSLSVERESRIRFADGVTDLFEAARETWQEVRSAGEGMGSRVTRDTDGEPNGALYVFAEAGARDLLGEFRSGTTPLEPLVERVNDDLGDEEPRSVFVLRPAEGSFVVVSIAFARDGVLARTVEETYF